MNDAESSASFMCALAVFSKALSQSGIAIYGVDYDLLHFGSWTIEAGERRHRSLLQWDGKELLMSLFQCEVADSRVSRDWQLVSKESVAQHSTNDEIFSAAEDFLLENFRS